MSGNDEKVKEWDRRTRVAIRSFVTLCLVGIASVALAKGGYEGVGVVLFVCAFVGALGMWIAGVVSSVNHYRSYIEDKVAKGYSEDVARELYSAEFPNKGAD